MARRVLLDTGVLVALINSADRDHRRCVDAVSQMRARLFTIEGVLVEAQHLVRKLPDGARLVIHAALRMHCELIPITRERLATAHDLIGKHSKAKLDLVDALLIASANELSIHEVLTLDQRDFAQVAPKLRRFPE